MARAAPSVHETGASHTTLPPTRPARHRRKKAPMPGRERTRVAFSGGTPRAARKIRVKPRLVSGVSWAGARTAGGAGCRNPRRCCGGAVGRIESCPVILWPRYRAGPDRTFECLRRGGPGSGFAGSANLSFPAGTNRGATPSGSEGCLRVERALSPAGRCRARRGKPRTASARRAAAGGGWPHRGAGLARAGPGRRPPAPFDPADSIRA